MATISKKEFKKKKKRVVRFPRGENVNDLDLAFRERKDCYLRTARIPVN